MTTHENVGDAEQNAANQPQSEQTKVPRVKVDEAYYSRPWIRQGRHKVRSYDKEMLVELLAGGEHSNREIGRLTGLHHSTVSRVARGEIRPDLYARIARAVEQKRVTAARIGISLLEPLVLRHALKGVYESGPEADRVREFLIKLFLEVPGMPREDPRDPRK